MKREHQPCVIYSPNWGYLAIIRFPALWVPEVTGAHVFRNRQEALKIRAGWGKSVPVEIWPAPPGQRNEREPQHGRI